jgi:hypothetical protein
MQAWLCRGIIKDYRNRRAILHTHFKSCHSRMLYVHPLLSSYMRRIRKCHAERFSSTILSAFENRLNYIGLLPQRKGHFAG